MTGELAAERDQVLVSAAVAPGPQKAVFQQSALQVILELLTYERRQVTAGALQRFKKSWVVFFDDGIQRRPFRPVPAVGGCVRCNGASAP